METNKSCVYLPNFIPLLFIVQNVFSSVEALLEASKISLVIKENLVRINTALLI